MLRVLLTGCNGSMGRTIREIVAPDSSIEIVAGVDQTGDASAAFSIVANIDDVREPADVIIDFSHPSLLRPIAQYAVRTQTPVVLATTGYSADDEEYVREIAKDVAVFRSMNMSYGVHAMRQIVRLAAQLLGNSCDIELIEAHHNQKADAPSGTAKMLLTTMQDALEQPPTIIHGREGIVGKRPAGEIAVHAVRGGTIPGEHTVLFAGCDELIQIRHIALSKKIFAQGAIKAARFLPGKPAGFYDMSSL